MTKNIIHKESKLAGRQQSQSSQQCQQKNYRRELFEGLSSYEYGLNDQSCNNVNEVECNNISPSDKMVESASQIIDTSDIAETPVLYENLVQRESRMVDNVSRILVLVVSTTMLEVLSNPGRNRWRRGL